MDQGKPTTPQPANLVLWAIWGALTSSIVIYLFVIQNLAGPREAADKGFDLLPRVLGAAAVFHLAISFVVRKRLGRLDGGDPEWFRRVLTLSIVSWALVEAIALYGLVLGMFGYPPRVYGGFILTGFVALVILAPTFAKLERR